MQEFVCELYGDGGSDVNETRYILFCRTSTTEENLPPIKSALLQHAKRACYQAAIHKRSMCAQIEAPSIVDHGWNLNKNPELKIKWYGETTTPTDLYKIVTCKCSTGCDSNRCSCKKHELMCTELCQCKSCKKDVNTAQLMMIQKIAKTATLTSMIIFENYIYITGIHWKFYYYY